jgi:hypothetical protein
MVNTLKPKAEWGSGPPNFLHGTHQIAAQIYIFVYVLLRVAWTWVWVTWKNVSKVPGFLDPTKH